MSSVDRHNSGRGRRFLDAALSSLAPGGESYSPNLLLRQRILNSVLLVGTILAGIGLAAIAPTLMGRSDYGLFSLELLLWFLALFLLVKRSLPYRLRAGTTTSMFLVLGVGISWSFGPISGGPAYLYCFAVMAGILLGFRAALAALALSFLVLGLLITATYHGFFPDQGRLLFEDNRWFLATASFVLLSSLSALSVTILVNGLERSLHKAEASRRLLETEMAQRTRAEERLVRQESLYRTTFEHTGTAMVLLDAEGVILKMNERFGALCGLAGHLVEGRRKLSDFFHEDDAPLMAFFSPELARDEDRPRHHEARFKNNDGEQRHVVCTVGAVPEAGSVVVSLLDMTERKLAEETLADSERRYRTLLGVLPDSVVVYDREGKVTYINDAFTRTYGWTLDELKGGRIASFVPPEEEEITREAWQRQLAEGMADFESRRFDKQGRLLEVQIRGANLTSPDGSYQGAVVLHRDISETRRAARALEASEEKFSRAFRQSPVWVVLSSLEEGQYLDVNDAFLETTGYTLDEVIGKTSQELGTWADIEERKRVVGVIHDFGFVRNAQVRRRTKDGRLVTMLFSGEVIEVGGEPCLLSVSQDITDLKLVEERYRQSEEQFRRAFYGTPTGMALVSLDRKLMRVNPHFTDLLGYDEEEMIGRDFNDFSHPDELAGGRERFRAIQEGREEYNQAEKRFLRRDGSIVWVLASNSLVRDAQGQPSHVVSHILDITDSMLAKAALEESEERLRTWFQTSPETLAVHRMSDDVFLDVNEGYLTATGHTREEIIGRSVRELNHWVEIDQLEQMKRQLEALGEIHNMEVEFRRKDGRIRTCLLSARMINLGGEPQVISVTRDVTSWKRAEHALRESEERSRAILQASPDPVVVYDSQGGTTYLNPAFTRVFGWGLEELQGRRVPFVPESEKELTASKIKQLFEYGESVGFDTKRLTKGGDVLDVMISAASVKNDRGEVVGMVVNLTDITEYNQIQRALKTSQERYRDLIDNITDFIYTHDMQGRFLSINRAASQTLGYRPEELIGRPIPEIMPPEHREAFETDYLIGLAERGKYNGMSIYLGTDGQRHYLEYRSELVNEEGGEPFVRGSAREVTDRILAEREQRKLEEQLFQAQKMEALGTLTGGVAHDFNNLLAAIKGNLDLASGSLGRDHACLRYLKNASSAADRAAMVTKQLLITARRAGRELKPLDMGLVVEQNTHLLSETIDRRITIVTQVEPGLHRVRADEAQMSQVIMNLCVNARDAVLEMMDRSGDSSAAASRQHVIEVKARNVLVGEGGEEGLQAESGPYVEVSVSDTGCGVPPELLDRIYDPFFTTKNLGEGTGLGLSTVYSIVKQHDGWLRVVSKPGEGSTFRLFLPAAMGAESEQADDSLPHIPAGGNETILVADDELDILTMAKEALGNLGYSVYTAGDGEEALRTFGEHASEIDLVLMDLSMPRLSGQQAAEKIQELKPGIKLIISSGHMQTELPDLDALLADNLAYLHKPYGLADLARTVRRLLDNGTA